ncbi:MAG: hypothetical protein LBK99_21295 [Opitutaceae bacterium]|jgi:hypothetical protein|nr:hypothetical protein [Opitutaceae bacterium]
MTQAISNLFGFLKELFGFKSKKLDLENSETMQANANAKTRQQLKDAAAKAAQPGHLDDLRKGVGE